MQRRHHYERAFEGYLRVRRIPYVAVHEARKALLPGGCRSEEDGGRDPALKSFDFVVYGEGGNLLVDIKGRRAGGTGRRAPGGGVGRMESWVTEDDVASLQRWEQLFGPGFSAVFIFIYQYADQPPDTLFEEVLEHAGSWYALRSVGLADYARVMKQRSPRWRTVDVPASVFHRISRPFAPAGPSGSGRGMDLGPMEALLEPLETLG